MTGPDMQQTAFGTADARFTADSEPSALMRAWRRDSGNADSLITVSAARACLIFTRETTRVAGRPIRVGA
ncbi:hypothetical protein [Streptomyces tropicalis]|uniref:Uncharacterized protein n=1 Tax=Streptomyces tropicalis TaxID=3034234 RepID=A0ABT6ACZ4_9ACTN|nr:hypothetical protein [Streptomyces tropicalis]MDF3302519.1 hypothetical protein [Streptomyces tropicalis]